MYSIETAIPRVKLEERLREHRPEPERWHLQSRKSLWEEPAPRLEFAVVGLRPTSGSMELDRVASMAL